MREIAADLGDGRLVLFHGVKIVYPDRWVLVVPSSDEPTCRVWAEGPSEEEAGGLADEFVARVEATVDRGQTKVT